jgi:hypothetical protein
LGLAPPSPESCHYGIADFNYVVVRQNALEAEGWDVGEGDACAIASEVEAMLALITPADNERSGR